MVMQMQRRNVFVIDHTANTKRANIYRNSAVICDSTEGDIVEVFGYLALEERFSLWTEYGKPQDLLYFSIEKGEVCDKESLDCGGDEFSWCIGWISDKNITFILVDVLNVLIDYYYSNLVKVSFDEPVATDA